MQNDSPRLTHFLLLFLLAFVWGSSFILMKMGLFGPNGDALFTSWEVGAMRITFAGLVLLPVTLSKLLSIPKDKWKWLFAVGAIGNTIPAFLFTAAQTKLASSVAGMLNALTPIFTLVVAIAFFHSQFSKRQMLGVGIGFIGAIGLVSINSDGGESEVFSGLLVVVATICYAFSVNIIRNKLSEIGSTTIAAVSLSMMAMGTTIWVVFFSDVFAHATLPGGVKGVIAIAVLGAIGTAGALMIFNRVIKETSALFASSVTYVIPVFASLWGYLDGEHLSWKHLLFAMIILVGVYLGRGKPKRLKKQLA